MSSTVWALSLLVVHLSVQLLFLRRALLRPHREPSARIAWVLIILALPAIGMLSYFLFGETNIGRKQVARYRKVSDRFAKLASSDGQTSDTLKIDPANAHLFAAGHSIDGFNPVGGNTAELMADSHATIDTMVADIDAAEQTVHLLFYIWLTDTNGLKVVEAVKRAASRGVTVRAMADDIGSRALIRSAYWGDMEKAGVRLVRALPVSNPFLHPIRGRIDLRNHRKIVVIDNRLTYCGSQNCADPEFRFKAKYAPWVDLMVRFEGPIALQNQRLFLQDWLSHTEEEMPELESTAWSSSKPGGIVAQAIGTGPTVRSSAMPELFETLMHAARETLTVTTPYYVPSEAMHSALCAAGRRGVDTRLVLPARNDSWVVAAASRSYYVELVEAGVRIFEYTEGLLHAKTLTLDQDIALIGSANLDRRSFDLNYENNILIQSSDLALKLRERQQDYIASSQEVHMETIVAWGHRRHLWNNAVAMFGPVL